MGPSELAVLETSGRGAAAHGASQPATHAPSHGDDAVVVLAAAAHASAHAPPHAPGHAPVRRGRARARQTGHAGALRHAVATGGPRPLMAPLVLSPDEFTVADHAQDWRWTLKRAIDVVGAVVGLLLSTPLLIVLALLIKIDSPGPVVFAQLRLGRGGRSFRCYKLRSMCADAEHVLVRDEALRAAYLAHGFKIPSHVDRRVTPLGRFLRTTSLDELPQFWNVLRGDMSLVGPRPIVEAELTHYPGSDRRVLLSVRPGLTGAWAVAGRSRIAYPQRAAIELDYVRDWSVSRDVAILAQTVVTVAAREGAT